MVSGLDPGLCCVSFLNSRTIEFHRAVDIRAFQIKTDGKSPEKETPPPTVVSGGSILPEFNVTAASANTFAIYFPDRPSVNPVAGREGVLEVFSIDGDNLLQLTNFGRGDTGAGGTAGFIPHGRATFLASANPTGENPANICQFFSIDKLAVHPPRQLTHLPSHGRPSGFGCRGFAFETACNIDRDFLTGSQGRCCSRRAPIPSAATRSATSSSRCGRTARGCASSRTRAA